MAGRALLGDFLPPCLQSDFLPLPPSFTPFLVAHETSPSTEREREREIAPLEKGQKGEGAIDLVFRSDRERGPFPSQTEGGFFSRPLDPPPLPPSSAHGIAALTTILDREGGGLSKAHFPLRVIKY